MLAYPVSLKKDGKFILVTFPDIPEAITQGDNESHALRMAAEALETAMDFYLEARCPIPTPSKAQRGKRLVKLPASVSAKVLLVAR
jgi:antitoxin HicB